MQLHALAMARQPHIGRVPIQMRGRQHVRAVHRDALGFVDRRRIAVIHVRVVLQVEAHRALIVEAHRERGALQPLQRAQRAVLHPHAALVAQEHHPVTGREHALAPLRRDGPIRSKRAGRAHLRARQLVEVAHVRPRVGQHDLAPLRLGPPGRIPALNQGRFGLVLGRMRVHHAGPLVALQRRRRRARALVSMRNPAITATRQLSERDPPGLRAHPLATMSAAARERRR